MRLPLLIAFVHLTGICSAQLNLVPNPSFEENDGCPNTSGKIWLAVPWEKVGGNGVITYYHECCDAIACGVPMNRYGATYPNSGQAYAHIGMIHANHHLSYHAEGNFLGTPLTDPLDEGKRYKVEFYLSLLDSARFAGRNIGTHFSIGKPSENINDLLDIIPQFRYDGGFLTDKDGWMKIEGSFVAEGGENYLTIGNFDGYFNSDTLHLNEGGTFPDIGYWEVAHYFIDDVSVVEDRSTGNGEATIPHFNVHPNPAQSSLFVELSLKDGEQAHLELFGITGNLLGRESLISGNNPVDISAYASGLYFFKVMVNSKPEHSGKQVIMR